MHISLNGSSTSYCECHCVDYSELPGFICFRSHRPRAAFDWVPSRTIKQLTVPATCMWRDMLCDPTFFHSQEGCSRRRSAGNRLWSASSLHSSMPPNEYISTVEGCISDLLSFVQLHKLWKKLRIKAHQTLECIYVWAHGESEPTWISRRWGQNWMGNAAVHSKPWLNNKTALSSLTIVYNFDFIRPTHAAHVNAFQNTATAS